MQRTSLKRNILLFSILVIAVLALFAALLLPYGTASADVVTSIGNNAGSDSNNGSGFVNLTFDVNGTEQESGSTNRDSTLDRLNANNSRQYRKRYIYATAVAAGAAGDEYTFIKSSIINSNEANFSVKLGDPDEAEFNIIEVEALSMVQSGTGYFSVDVRKDATGSTERKTVYFKVTINDTLVQGSTDHKSLYVGYKVNAAGEEYVGDNVTTENGQPVTSYDTVNKVHQSIKTVDNFSTVEIDLSELLLGRALYVENTQAGGTDTALKDGSTKMWTVKSVTNFKIDDVTFRGIPGLTLKNQIKSSTPTNSPYVRVSPRITGYVEVYSSTISSYNQQPGNSSKEFWNETHVMEVSISKIDARSTDTKDKILIPFKFAPANPQKKEISSNILRLNVTSQNTYDLASQTYIRPDENDDSSDYCSIIIRPTDLMEYSAPISDDSEYAPKFDHNST
ncbi:MAG: hypothetical protein K2O39_04550, partial [Clostridiales bacterium]|nr:hypothetical protein [Clostridiales bacterium]